MCTNIFIAANKKLPEIPWNSEEPGFGLQELDHDGERKMVQSILKSKFIYKVFSFMGCACGLSYDEYSKNDNHNKRMKDVGDFVFYLDIHKKDTKIQLFTSSFEEFPDTYEQAIFKTSDLSTEEFFLEEMIVFEVV